MRSVDLILDYEYILLSHSAVPIVNEGRAPNLKHVFLRAVLGALARPLQITYVGSHRHFEDAHLSWRREDLCIGFDPHEIGYSGYGQLCGRCRPPDRTTCTDQ